MNLTYCDICEQVIKSRQRKVIFSVYETTHGKNEKISYNNVYEYLKALRKKQEDVEVNEICKNCYKILCDLLQYRVKGLNKIKKNIDKILGLKKTYRKRKKTRKRTRRRKKNDKRKNS